MSDRTPEQFGALYGKDFMGTTEAARMMGISQTRVLEEIRDGRLRAEDVAKMGAKRPHYRTRPEWIRAWHEARTVNRDAA